MDRTIDKTKENYAGAILIAWRLYCKFIKSIGFKEFEELVTNDYNAIDCEVRSYK